MAARSISSTYDGSIRDLNILLNYYTGSANMDAKFQYIIAEIIMLRLFSILENAFADIAFRLACNTPYRNGAIPILQTTACTSISHAHTQMLTFNRGVKSKIYLKWTEYNSIKDSSHHILSLNDCFLKNVRIHNSIIDEMRIVRNHIAHRTPSTRTKYNALLIRKYGARVKMSTGAFLISTKRQPNTMLYTYIASSKILLDDITKG